MPKYEVKLLAPAWRELDAIAEMHMALAGAASAEKITNRILDALELLSSTPFMGKEAKQRELSQQGFRILIIDNYLCFYKVGLDAVEIYHIADGRKDYPKLFEDWTD